MTEFELDAYGKTTDREDFGIVFLQDGVRRQFALAFTGTLAAMWQANTPSEMRDIAQRIADALMAAGAASSATEGFQFNENNSTSSLDVTLAAIAEDFDQFQWPPPTLSP